MTAEFRNAASRQSGLHGLAGGLAILCLVLFLLAIEQRHAVSAWQAIRNDAIPTAGRLADWASRWMFTQAEGVNGLQAALADPDDPRAAGRTDAVLSGEFDPADEATRAALGGATFVGAMVRFDTGQSFRTSPLRIAAGHEHFVSGQTFADRLGAPDDAQIELRQITPAARGEPVRPSALCGGDRPGMIALLHRGDRVDLMLFRAPARLGPDAPDATMCGAWSFRGR